MQKLLLQRAMVRPRKILTRTLTVVVHSLHPRYPAEEPPWRYLIFKKTLHLWQRNIFFQSHRQLRRRSINGVVDKKWGSAIQVQV